MARINNSQLSEILYAIANREGSARELSTRFKVPIEELRELVESHRNELERIRESIDNDDSNGEPTPKDLSELWITNKTERLRRYQNIVDMLIDEKQFDTVGLREIRSYMVLAANELGQLLHRGAGSGDEVQVNYTISGVDMDNLK